MGEVGESVKSVRNYSTLHTISKERRSHLHHGGSQIILVFRGHQVVFIPAVNRPGCDDDHLHFVPSTRTTGATYRRYQMH